MVTAAASPLPPDESDVLEPLLSSLERLAATEIDSTAIDREGHIPRPLLATLGELGWYGLSLPEAYGGAGLTLGGACKAVTALARHDRSVATSVGLHLGLGTRGLVAFGSEGLRERYLPVLATGKAVASFATTESEAGSDLGAIRTQATELPGGRLRVEGDKVWVTNGGFAEVVTITAATPGLGGARRGHSLILLERGDRGVAFQPEEHKLGIRGSSTCGLHLDGVEVPLERVIGEPGAGMVHLQHVLAWGRTMMAAGCCGAALAAQAKANEWVTFRKQFGKTLLSFEVVREQVADLAATLFTMVALVARTAAAEEERDVLLLRSTAAKVFCSEGNWEAADVTLQLHGGSGYIEETGVSLLLRDARITRIFEGANDVLLVHAGTIEAASPRPLDPPLPEPSPLRRELRAIEEQIAGWRGEQSRRLGVRLLRQQRLLHKLGRLVVLREAAQAAVERAEAEGTPLSLATATHFLAMARARMLPVLAPPLDLGPVDAIADSVTRRA